MNLETLSESHSGRRYLRRRHELADTAIRIIAASRFLAGCLVESGFPKDKIVVHYIGVNTEEFAPNPEITRENVVLFVGASSKRKAANM